MRIEDFPAYARLDWAEIRQSLREGRYQPSPVCLWRTMATHTGMTNQWLAQQELLSIRDL